MKRYLLTFSYLGTNYRGLQKQVSNPRVLDVDCVQGAIECALLSLKPKIIEHPRFIPSSRTDAGVHALENAAHIEIENPRGVLYDPNTIVRFLNRYLIRCKHEIRIFQCIPITNNFHARFSAKSRSYIYRLMIPKDFKDYRVPVSETNRCSVVRLENFDIERAKEACKLFVGLRDFQTFAAVNKGDRKIQYRREISKLTIEKATSLLPVDSLSENFNFWHVRCKARSFLHNQIRRIVGTLIALGAEKVTEKDVITMLQVPSHHSWNSKIVPAVANGLYLEKVEYDPIELEENTIKYNENDLLFIEDYE